MRNTTIELNEGQLYQLVTLKGTDGSKSIITIELKDNQTMCCCDKYDKYDNLVYSKSSDGYEVWRTYNENNKQISFKDSDGAYIIYDENFVNKVVSL